MNPEKHTKKSNHGVDLYSENLRDSPIIVSDKVYSVAERIFDISPKVDNKTYEKENVKIENTEIKRKGRSRCHCGSGKSPQDCCLKHLRLDKNPLATIKEYEHKEIENEIDEYDIPKSHKEYTETGASEESLIMIKKHEEEKQEEDFCICGSRKPKKECCFREDFSEVEE